MLIQNQVGPVTSIASMSAGTQVPGRAGNMGETIISKLHGDFYEANYQGKLFSTGTTAAVALTSTTATATGLTATATPILGIYNPSGSGYNAVILQTVLNTFLNNVTSVAPGAYVWAAAVGQGAVSTGLTPWNRKTLTQTGSVCKGFAGATALTGLAGALTVMTAAPFQVASGLLTTTVAAATPTPSVGGLEVYNGSLIVPPGGVLALMNTISVTTHSFYGSLLWEEVPI
jgi:hypothetical protein